VFIHGINADVGRRAVKAKKLEIFDLVHGAQDLLHIVGLI
jgi:hypothetical protein